MFGILLFVYSLALGWLAARRLFRGQPFLVRIWAGILFGLAGLMWGVIPFAFLFGFSAAAHAGGLFLWTMIVLLILRYVPAGPRVPEPKGLPPILLAGIVFFTSVIFAMMFRHTLFPRADGLYAGPGTYGDLPMHLGIITGIAEQKSFPPDYFFFPGIRLAYPFLVDSLSSTLHLAGLPLRPAVLLPSFFLTLTVAAGFLILAQEILRRAGSSLLAGLLFFFNGGFGFVYFMEGLKKDPQSFTRLFTGGHMTPNSWGKMNLCLWNVIAHILVPQRATLAGWAFLFFGLWLLYLAVNHQDRRLFLISGVVAGLMPMIHTSSFLVMIVFALTWFIVYAFSAPDKKNYGRQWLRFGIPLVCLAVPQLLIWALTLTETKHGLRFHFNWANSSDFWPWFWIKNAGLVFLLAGPAILAGGRERLRFYSGAIVLFLLAEFFVFSPYHTDNNKLFFIWYACTAIIVADYLAVIYQRMKGHKGRGLFVGMIIFFSVLSGLLTVIHDFTCSWKVFSTRDVAAAEFVKKETRPDAIFVSSHFHNNPVHSLAGRTILLGYDGWTFSHGLDYGPRSADVRKMYTAPGEFERLRDHYGVDYLLFGEHERAAFQTGPEYFEKNYPKIFDDKSLAIYAVSEDAVNGFETGLP